MWSNLSFLLGVILLLWVKNDFGRITGFALLAGSILLAWNGC